MVEQFNSYTAVRLFDIFRVPCRSKDLCVFRLKVFLTRAFLSDIPYQSIFYLGMSKCVYVVSSSVS